ncbi:MAG: GILT family protein, partial [Nanoarchaeota archaeon]|nr:GILT family protein [Nanoarchaeota archaeon]
MGKTKAKRTEHTKSTKHTKSAHHKAVHTHKPAKKSPMTTLGIALIVIAAVMIIATFIYTNKINDRVDTTTGAGGTSTLGGVSPEDKVKVEFYVMSQCPYGTQVEDAIAPVLDKIGDSVDFHLDFIVTENADGTFRSLHGEPETQGNIIQLCAKKHYPENYMNMVICMNKNAGAIPGNWESCADGMDKATLKTCYEGNEGKQLLSASAARATAKQASGSPTIYIGDQPYQGARDTAAFLAKICTQIPDHQECKNLPACASDADCTAEPKKIGKCENPGVKEAKCTYIDDAEVEIIVVNDKECASCNPAQLIQASQFYFKNSEVKTVDVSDEEGQALIAEMGLEKAPAIIFSSGVADAAAFKGNPQLAAAFDKVGDRYKLKDAATGSTHWIDNEKYAEFLGTLGIEVGDNKPQIDFYVMSYCPYGNQAEEAIEPVYQALKDNAIFNPRYVWYSNYQGGGPNYCLDAESKYCSMHGIQEANQNIRELCVNHQYG